MPINFHNQDGTFRADVICRISEEERIRTDAVIKKIFRIGFGEELRVVWSKLEDVHVIKKSGCIFRVDLEASCTNKLAPMTDEYFSRILRRVRESELPASTERGLVYGNYFAKTMSTPVVIKDNPDLMTCTAVIGVMCVYHVDDSCEFERIFRSTDPHYDSTNHITFLGENW